MHEPRGYSSEIVEVVGCFPSGKSDKEKGAVASLAMTSDSQVRTREDSTDSSIHAGSDCADGDLFGRGVAIARAREIVSG